MSHVQRLDIASLCPACSLHCAAAMKKTITHKRPLVLTSETIRQLGAHDLTAAAGGASGTYCADCGSGTACTQIKPVVD